MHDPPRILIVDDNETNRDILATRLATQGYDLCQATDGQEALDVCEAAAYPGAKAVITTTDGEWLGSQADRSFAAI